MGKRRGAGVVLWIALGVVLVAGILLSAQFMLGRSTRQEAAAAYLGARATAVLESGLDEATFKAFAEAAGRGTQRDLGEALRAYVPPARPGERRKPDRDGWLARFDVPLPLTREAYAASPDVALGTARVGVIEQEPYPASRGLRTNESRGLVAVEADVTVSLPGASLAIGRRGRQELEYKTIVVGLPWPFNRYTFFDRGMPSLPSSSATTATTAGDRFTAYLAEFDRRRTQGVKDLPEFPVLAMDPSAKTTSAPAAIPATGPVYSVIGHVADAQVGGGLKGWTIPALWGENILGGDPGEEIFDQSLAMTNNMFRKASAKESAELDRYYGQLEEPAWHEKRTHRFRDMAGFVAATSHGGVLDLAGVYWVDGPVTLAHEYRGHGVIVTPHPDGIVVRKAKKSDAFDGHLTLVATRGDVRAAGNPRELHATLAAVHGTVRGLAQTKLYGTVYVSYVAPDREDGPEIQKPADADWDPIQKAGDQPAPGLARRMRAFLVPRPLRRDFTSTRRRI